MGIKEELERLVSIERQKLEAQEAQRKGEDEAERQRFAPVRALLREIVEAGDPSYITASIGESFATVSLGPVVNGRQNREITLAIGRSRWLKDADQPLVP
jgi:hypothetical protein